jgi:2-hydroxychromene-2-carboxylate isomerase
VEAFRKRFSEALDVGEDEVVADAASKAGLDPEMILSAGHSEELRAEAAAGWQVAAERDQIFGVPSFVYAGKLYWGQDRMHFLRGAIERKAGAA